MDNERHEVSDLDAAQAEIFRDIDRLIEKFQRLQKAAARMGFNTYVLFHTYDPLTNRSYASGVPVGDTYALVGAMREALRRLEELNG